MGGVERLSTPCHSGYLGWMRASGPAVNTFCWCLTRAHLPRGASISKHRKVADLAREPFKQAEVRRGATHELLTMLVKGHDLIPISRDNHLATALDPACPLYSRHSGGRTRS